MYFIKCFKLSLIRKVCIKVIFGQCHGTQKKVIFGPPLHQRKKERKKGMCQRQNERQYNTVLTHYSYLSYVSKGYFKNAG